MIIAIIALAIMNIAQYLVNLGLMNRLLMQAKVPTLQPVLAPQTKREEEQEPPKRRPIFTVPIQD